MVTFAAPPADAAADAAPIVILHTNDVHCGIDDAIGYAGLAAYKAEMEAAYGADRVTLLDAGDAIQGGALGTLSDGAFVVDIMNQAGYDLAVPGNHEFDYGMENFLTLADSRADFPWLSCNFMDLTAGTPALDPYLIQDYGDIQIAYVGISTPESLTKTAPACFQDENGNFIYGFCQGQDGALLYAACSPPWIPQGRREPTMWLPSAISAMKASRRNIPRKRSSPIPTALTYSSTDIPMRPANGV